MKFKLRPYQEEASKKAVEFFLDEKKNWNALEVLPTASGKSLILADIAARLNDKVLVFSPTKEILEQNYKKYCSYGFNNASIYSASFNSKEINDVTFATIGSVKGHPELFTDFKYILIDEVHLVKPESGMYKDFLDKLKSKVIGLTATPFRLYSYQNYGSILKFLTRSRDKIFKELIYYVQVEDMAKNGYICLPNYYSCPPPQWNEGNLQLNSTCRDYTDQSVKQEYERVDLYGWLVSVVNRLLSPKRGGQRKGILVFTKFVKEAQMLTRSIPNCEMVCGETPRKEREAIIERFRNGETKVLVNSQILVVGFDYPALDTVVYAKPTRSLAQYYQVCLDMETEILTEKGFKKYSDINYCDKVAAYQNGKIIWADIENIVHRKAYNGEKWVSFKNQHSEFRITWEHNLLVKSDRAKCDYKLEKAKDVMQRKGMFKIPVSGIMPSKGLPLTDAQIRLIGYVLSDGNVSKSNRTITISQSLRYPSVIENIEKTIQECGLRYGKVLIKRKGDMAKYYDVYHFYISYGEPRRITEKHLHGWNILEKYIVGCKTWCNEYWKMSEHQFDVLISAINEGDGAKKSTVDYTSNTYTICVGIKKDYADKLQALAIMRGYRCNLKVYQREHPLYILLLKKQTYTTIAGKNTKDEKGYKRGRFTISDASSNDEMWCVKNKYGTLVTRRNGYVTIMGNCGRIIRQFPGKQPWFIDLCGTYERFGKVEDLKLIDQNGRGKWVIMSGNKQLTNTFF